MKAQLRDYVRIGGETTRNPELDRVDFDKRVVWLKDGRWVPFENVVVGDSGLAVVEPEEGLKVEVAHGRIDRMNRGSGPFKCRKCIRRFPTEVALDAHDC